MHAHKSAWFAWTLPLGLLAGLLVTACGDAEGGAGGDADDDAPVFGSDAGAVPGDGGEDGGDGASDLGSDAPLADVAPDVADDTGVDAGPTPDAGDDSSLADTPADSLSQDGAGDADTDVRDGDAGPETGGDAADTPPNPTCEAPLVDLMAAAFEHPSRADARRVPADVDTASAFPALPGSTGTPGGCYAPPIQCADGAGLTGTEVLHRFVPPAPGTYYATTDIFYATDRPPAFFGEAGFVPDPVLYVLDAESPTAGVLGCNDDVWPGDPHAAVTFEVLPADEGAGLEPVFVVVDAADQTGNGLRYGLEVGLVAVSTSEGTTCQYPTIGTACGTRVEPLFCVPDDGGQTCLAAANAPTAPVLASVTSTAVLFPPEPPAEPHCRGVARDAAGNLIPIVQLRFQLAGSTALGLERVTLAHALFGDVPLAIDFPGGPIAPTGDDTFDVEIRLCLPVSLVPFAPDGGENPIDFTVVDDLGWRTEPPVPSLGRASNTQVVNVYDPREE